MVNSYDIKSNGHSGLMKLVEDQGEHVEAVAYAALYRKFVYYTEVQLATLEGLEGRKSTSKSEIQRQRSIVNDMMAVLVDAGLEWRGTSAGYPRINDWLKAAESAAQARFAVLDDSKALEQELSRVSGRNISAIWAEWADDNQQSIRYRFNPGNSSDVCNRAERGVYSKQELTAWAQASCGYHLVSTARTSD